jgi:glycerate 2-kinase
LTVDKKQYNLNNFDRIIVVGGGKAARRTGAELVRILRERITAGVLNVYKDQAKERIFDRIKLFAADHPTPNEEGHKGAQADDRTAEKSRC